jgi:hypothetical protein
MRGVMIFEFRGAADPSLLTPDFDDSARQAKVPIIALDPIM